MKSRITIGVCCLFLSLPGIGNAKEKSNVEWDVQRTMQLEDKPVDTAFSAGGRIYVLTEGPKVYAFEQNGELKGKVELKGKYNSIETSPMGDMLFLTNEESKTVEIVTIDFIVDINVAGSPFKGPADAPVTIAVFSDFQCPYCSKVNPLLEEVMKLYPKEVKVVFKNYPLSMHKYAEQAAIAALAADKQGKFWPFHDQLFANMNALSDAKVEEIAKELQLDMEKFNKDKADPALRNKVQLDVQDGAMSGVRGTPSIFVNGRTVKNRSVEGFKEMIDQELKN